MSANPLLLFDGHCNMCNFWVDFIMRHEKEKNFHFVSLQSELGQKIRNDYRVAREVDSLIVVKDEKVYLYSDAVLEVLKAFPLHWRILLIFQVIPKRWRDGLYKQIAKRRYLFAGKSRSCRLPTPDERGRFLS